MSEETKQTTKGEEEVAAQEPAAESQEEKTSESTDIPEVSKKDKGVELKHQDVEPGMLIRVHERIKDTNAKGEEKERVQVFEGLVISLKGTTISRTMTVRKNSKGWMVEKIFPLNSPNIEKVEVVKKYQTRRANLSYLRGRFRRKMKEVEIKN